MTELNQEKQWGYDLKLHKLSQSHVKLEVIVEVGVEVGCIYFIPSEF